MPASHLRRQVIYGKACADPPPWLWCRYREKMQVRARLKSLLGRKPRQMRIWCSGGYRNRRWLPCIHNQEAKTAANSQSAQSQKWEQLLPSDRRMLPLTYNPRE